MTVKICAYKDEDFPLSCREIELVPGESVYEGPMIPDLADVDEGICCEWSALTPEQKTQFLSLSEELTRIHVQLQTILKGVSSGIGLGETKP